MPQGYPYPGAQQPTFDPFGSQIQVNPQVQKSTAGNLGPGQTLISCCGRVASSSSGTVTVPLFTVPAGKTWFETDFDLSTISTNEIDVQVQAGGIPIDRAAVSNTSPINTTRETQPLAPGGTQVALVIGQTSTNAQNLDFYVAGYLQAPPQ